VSLPITFRRFSIFFLVLFVGGILAFGQSTGVIQGTVVDATGAAVPHAMITITNVATGEERTVNTDAAGLYVAPSLPVGTYRVDIKATGMAPMMAENLVLSVGSTVRQDFTLQVATATQAVEVSATAALVDSTTTSVGSVVNQMTVQEIPLNGRHFVDLSLLTAGTVTPPANGFLTAPLRGQGSFSFNSAGAREDSVNFMVNGINLSDPNQNQITFQPVINTVEEFKVDNSTFSAEYGRNSGSIVNIATRSGTNTWHGEAYEFIRNNDLDARNFTDPTQLASGAPFPMAPFKRNQFGGDGGGALKKDKTFVFLSYEGLRQRQAVSLGALTLTPAEVAQAQATSDSFIKSLLPLIPAVNSGSNQFVGSAVAPVDIDQGTANVSEVFSDKNRLNFYYAIQEDRRNEPPSTDNNSFPGGGDMRDGKRQLMTINEVWAASPSLVNEARLGYNRIYIVFAADNNLNAAGYGIDTGINAPIGLPQISVAGGQTGGGFTFGGINNFPQGRGDNTVVLSDTLSWIHGNHTVKFGGEVRRANSDNFEYTPGTFSFPSVAAFLADQANSFTVTTSNRSNRTYGDSVGAFVTDSWKVAKPLTLQLGVRYDFYGTPTEAENRFVVFNSATDMLEHVGQGGGPSLAYNNSAKNFEPRVGFAWTPFGGQKTVIRGAYGLMTDQPTLGLVTGLAGNPPYAFPVSFVPTTSVPFVSLADALTLAGGSVAPLSVAHNYKDAYVSEWNMNVQQQLANNFAVMVSYVGTKGSDLNIERNYNQLINGVRPFPALSPNSPIDPGMPLSNILVYESDGNSSYQALWVKATKRFAQGLQFEADYTFSKSIDENSRNVEGYVIQNSYDIAGDRGLSDFDARNRIVLDAVYDLPFKGNRLKEGWELSLIEQTQSGNPINFHITNTAFTGEATLRPSVTGPVITGFTPATNGSASTVTYIQNPSVFYNQGNAFGNLGRNTVIGPGFSNLDFSIVKNTKITERLNWRLAGDFFDLLNQVNFTQPGSTVGTSTLGLITGGTRFPGGDFGTSRQIQLSMKLQF
jgi:hypothetical protein